MLDRANSEENTQVSHGFDVAKLPVVSSLVVSCWTCIVDAVGLLALAIRPGGEGGRGSPFYPGSLKCQRAQWKTCALWVS